MKKKKIEKIALDRGWDTHRKDTPYKDVANGVGLLKVMSKINEIIEVLNEK